MIGGRDKDQGIFHEGLRDHAQLLGGLAHDVEVVEVLLQALYELITVGDLQGGLYTRVALTESSQKVRSEVLRRGDDGELQVATLKPLVGGEIRR